MAVEEPIRCIYTPNVAAERGGAHARNAEIAISCRRRFIIQRNRWYAARISLYYLHLCPYDAMMLRRTFGIQQKQSTGEKIITADQSTLQMLGNMQDISLRISVLNRFTFERYIHVRMGETFETTSQNIYFYIYGSG